MLKSLGLLSQEDPLQTEPESRDSVTLSTGSFSLDQSLETHLSICAVLLRVTLLFHTAKLLEHP